MSCPAGCMHLWYAPHSISMLWFCERARGDWPCHFTVGTMEVGLQELDRLGCGVWLGAGSKVGHTVKIVVVAPRNSVLGVPAVFHPTQDSPPQALCSSLAGRPPLASGVGIEAYPLVLSFIKARSKETASISFTTSCASSLSD